jgi:hypothetical protein
MVRMQRQDARAYPRGRFRFTDDVRGYLPLFAGGVAFGLAGAAGARSVGAMADGSVDVEPRPVVARGVIGGGGGDVVPEPVVVAGGAVMVLLAVSMRLPPQ